MGKKITIADIASTLNLSKTTVSFVMNNHNDKGISEETKLKVLKTANDLGYTRKFRLVDDRCY